MESNSNSKGKLLVLVFKALGADGQKVTFKLPRVKFPVLVLNGQVRITIVRS